MRSIIIRRLVTFDPLRVRLICLFVAFAAMCFMAASPDAGGATLPHPYKVGYQVLDLVYLKDGQEQTLTVAVWYPTAAQPKTFIYGGSTKGNVAPGGMPRTEGGPFPLLVFSHGYGGSGLGAVFLAEALAARGWIVACPDHNDRYSAVRIRTGRVKDFDRRSFLGHAREIAASGPADRDKYIYRLDEMETVLDKMLTSDRFGKLIDRDRVAVGGHSLGGFTALGLCGTIQKRHNPNIKAVLLFSTGAGGYMFREDELGAVRVPSMLLMGEREESQARGFRTMRELSEKIFRNLPSPKYFLEVKGAGHFSFNNNLSEKLASRLLSGTERQFDVIRSYSIDFLEKHVSGAEGSGRVLERTDPMLTRYLTEPVLSTSN